MTKKLLLIEDDEVDRLSIKRALMRSQFQCSLVTAGSLAEGLELMSEDTYDCLLLDQNLPDGTGLERLGAFIGHADSPRVPVVFLTGMEAEDMALEALRAGAQDFLQKDTVTPGTIHRAIVNAIERHHLIADRRRSQRAHQASESKLEGIFNGAADGLILIDTLGTIEEINPAGEAIFGYEPGELLGQGVEILMPQAVAEAHPGYLERYLSGQGAGVVNTGARALQGLDKHGEIIEIELAVTRLDVRGELKFIGSVRDVSELRVGERALRREKEFSSAIFNSTSALVLVVDEENCLQKANHSCEAITGYSVADLANGQIWEKLAPDGARGELEKMIAQVFGGQPAGVVECEINTSGQKTRTISWHFSPLADDGGNTQFITCTGTDVTDIRKAEKHYRILADNMNDVVFLCDANGGMEYVSPSCRERLGYAPLELLALDNIFSVNHPDDDELCRRAYLKSLARGEPIEYSARLKTKEGTYKWFEMVARAFSSLGGGIFDGHIDGLVVAARDITDRREVEEQLRQTQKMDAVGQLTGGIAHDFNNILQIILANLQLLQRRCKDQPEMVSTIERVTGASKRAADLTKRLLAFSRRQVLETASADLNDLLDEFEELIHRTIGDHVEVQFQTDDKLWVCLCDVAQFEAAVLNLCINARDAMPEGGQLTVSTSNIAIDALNRPDGLDIGLGEYVAVAVEDTGTGIAEEDLGKVLEPFFTTKDKDRGAGLGLSMVYGYLKQVGGTIGIESQVGKGTKITMYFPRSVESDTRRYTAEKEIDIETIRLSGNILLIEDDEDVRHAMVELLDKTGCRIREVGDGETAIQEAHSDPNIDLLITDVVLPRGFRGPLVVDEIKGMIPDLNVLYISGYADLAFNEDRPLGDDESFLAKPITEEVLLTSVQKMLARRSKHKQESFHEKSTATHSR